MNIQKHLNTILYIFKIILFYSLKPSKLKSAPRLLDLACCDSQVAKSDTTERRWTLNWTNWYHYVSASPYRSEYSTDSQALLVTEIIKFKKAKVVECAWGFPGSQW